jgi:hypothetical protein
METMVYTLDQCLYNYLFSGSFPSSAVPKSVHSVRPTASREVELFPASGKGHEGGEVRTQLGP